MKRVEIVLQITSNLPDDARTPQRYAVYLRDEIKTQFKPGVLNVDLFMGRGVEPVTTTQES